MATRKSAPRSDPASATPGRQRVRGEAAPGRFPCQIVFGTSREQAAEIAALVDRYRSTLSRSEVMRAAWEAATAGDVVARLDALVATRDRAGS